jgi:hypothetical protein
MKELPIEVPPQLEEATGYPGQGRLVSFCWTSLGDTVVYDDARLSGTGHGWGWLAFSRHPAVAPHLAGADLGSSEAEGSCRVLVDRESRRACLATAAEARRALLAQWPVSDEPLPLSAEEVEAVIELVRDAMASRPLPSPAEVVASMRRHSAVVAAMTRWLDEWLAGREGTP